MKRFGIKTRAAQLTWLQLLCLGISALAYMADRIAVVVVMVLLATFFGIGAMLIRVQEAKQITRRQPPARYRRK